MSLKMEYFVFALFLNAVASSPYYVHKNSGLQEHNFEALDQELDIASSNEEVYLPRNEPSYMSPIPTRKDRKLNKAIFRDSRSLSGPSIIENDHIVKSYENERNKDDHIKIPNYNYRQPSSETKYFKQVNRIPDNLAISSSSSSNPSSAVDENALLTRLLRQNKPVTNDFVTSSGQVNSKKSRGLEVLNRYETNNNQPLKIQASPDDRITFQQSVVPDLTNLESYRPAIPVNGFDINREWSKISNEPGHLPEWINERLKYPVDFQNNRQQIPEASNGKSHDIQKIISDPRIQNVLTSTKQTKRYMVVHPDGTVEHVDSLEPISAQHPNYVLVNAEQVLNNTKTKAVTSKNKHQDQPSQKLFPQSESVSSILKSTKLKEYPQAVVENSFKKAVVQTLPSTVIEEVTSSFEPSIPEPSVASPLTVADTLLTSKFIPKTTTEIVETKEDNEHEATKKLGNIEVQEVTVTRNSSNTLNIITNNDEADENIANTVPITTDVTTTSKNFSTQESGALEETTPKAKETAVTRVTSSVTPEDNVKDDGNTTVQSTRNVENSEVAQDNEIEEIPHSGKPALFATSDPDFWQKVTEGRDANNIFFFFVQSSPRVEKDTVRTVFPDGAILEEWTETVWEGEGVEPKITKTSKVIHPSD